METRLLIPPRAAVVSFPPAATQDRSRRRAAFTLVDLLAVLAVLALCAMLLVPALARTRQDTRAFQCLNNNRELNRAWHQFVDDSQGRLPYASPNPADPAASAWAWVTGTLDFNPANRSNWDPTYDIMRSPLWPYCGKSLSPWKCPADTSSVVVQGARKPRVRSYSMNFYLGGYGGSTGGWTMNGKIFLQASEFNDPPPAELFVFLDVREDSINSGSFYTDMAEFLFYPDQFQIMDYPGIYHDRAAAISFADGHTELHRWQGWHLPPPITPEPVPYPASSIPDIAWLQQHATRAN